MRILLVHTAYWGAISHLQNSREVNGAVPDQGQDLVLELALAANYTPELLLQGLESRDYVFNWPFTKSESAKRRSNLMQTLQFEKWQWFTRFPGLRLVFDYAGVPSLSLRECIRKLKPEVVCFLNINVVTPSLARWIKDLGIELWGQHASALPPLTVLKKFDFLFSALPWQVELFERLGVRSEFLPLGLPSMQIDKTPKNLVNRELDVAFVGSVGRSHAATLPLLQNVAERVPGFRIYTSASPEYLKKVGLYKAYAGQAFGDRALEIYRNSKIVLNRHIPIARGYSANFRMFEATGSGAILLTEESKNLSEMFAPDIEVLTYRSPKGAVQKIQHVLNKAHEFQPLASAGHAKTIDFHTIESRAQTIAGWLRR